MITEGMSIYYHFAPTSLHCVGGWEKLVHILRLGWACVVPISECECGQRETRTTWWRYGGEMSLCTREVRREAPVFRSRISTSRGALLE